MGYWHSRGLRGSYLEDCINQSNQLYLDQGLAVVQKLPTAIKPVELDKERGTIKLAYFDEKSTVDYMGNVQGIPICFDAKETNLKRLPISNIHAHQIEFMDAFQRQDGLSFLIVFFKQLDEAYLLPFESLKPYWDAAQKGTGRKSIPHAAFDPQLRIPAQGNLLIHYLDALNTYLNLRKDL
ncbi:MULTISPECIES: Holliday junction resolvase RecU [Eubacterium]|uniref:Holliday junction resolvase RecU n=2 Tax=Eubacterium TaxID=1730 RepID=A0A1H4DQI0_9FIRM|nr:MULTISPECIES: Holliday junction resolvase RecU [Eubacterium]MDD4692285.1 Holliday junction resolvase RecU [Eubacterium aggregans]SDY35942.1 recombination protein U [Eubacterium barkeri]SEA74887.1 recombination protein U [Eubacterium aggregans]